MREKKIIVEDIFYDLIHVAFTGNGPYGYDKIPRYDIDFIDYMKEILLGKYTTFKSVDRYRDNPYKAGIVTDVRLFEYKPNDEYIIVKLKGSESEFIVSNSVPVVVDDYKPGPLHKQLKIRKDAKKYNL